MFTRSPEVGKVKTRLSETLGTEVVLEIYKAFGRDVIETVKKHTDHIRISYYPMGTVGEVREWLGEGFNYLPQKGKNLGDRMRNAFTGAFSDGFCRVVLLGADMPDLPGSIIDEAFSKLSSHPSVIGPALDGGYYLIGFQQEKFFPQAFDNIPWGTQHVLNKTLSIFKGAKQNIHILPSWQDTDDYKDLLALRKRIAEEKTIAHHSAGVLKAIPL
ncbi:MAG TPA: glycosyltransferase [Deltaproteobacteria bacterium]|nr:glycosyltransferase [Deltaproteobacteria bacterium]